MLRIVTFFLGPIGHLSCASDVFEVAWVSLKAQGCAHHSGLSFQASSVEQLQADELNRLVPERD